MLIWTYPNQHLIYVILDLHQAFGPASTATALHQEETNLQPNLECKMVTYGTTQSITICPHVSIAPYFGSGMTLTYNFQTLECIFGLLQPGVRRHEKNVFMKQL